MAATILALESRGAKPIAALFEPLPDRYEMLRPVTTWHDWDASGEILKRECDAVVVVDTCAISQLEPVAQFLQQAPRTLVIDHHATRDPIGTRPGDLRLLDDTAAAASLIVAEWIRSAGVALTPQLATALFVGIATDCGWFRFSNTDARTMRMAADLVEAGADPSSLYDKINQRESTAKLRLIANMLANLELRAEDKLAVMYLRDKDFEAAGADHSMTSDLVNEAARLGCTEATILFTEEADHTIRVNFRSKNTLDVSELARRYGGGGHARAAGARLRGKWEDVVPRVVGEVCDAL